MSTLTRVLLTVVICLVAVEASAQSGLGVRGGVGTDVSGGIAYGGGVNFLIPVGNSSFEPGVMFFGGSFSESSKSGVHTYDEETKVRVFVVMGNYLFKYAPDRKGLFFITGIGLGAISVDWTESSKTDTSLGKLLPGGGSTHSEDGVAAGSVFNFGVGLNVSRQFDVRFEVPVLLTFAPPGGSSSVVPTFMATAGVRF